MYNCQLCNNTPIPEKMYELLDWEAAGEEELIICPKCLAALLKNKDGKVDIKMQKKTAVLVRVMWNKTEDGDEEAGSAPDHLADSCPE